MRRTFEGFTPPVGVQWIAWRIEESATPDAGTVIEGPTTIAPAITDVTDPPTLTVTTNSAALDQGWYRIVWLDGQGTEVATAWQQRRTLSPYAPTVGDIATILHSRLVEDGGFRVPNFTDGTRPTAQQVQDLITLYAPLMLARLGRLDNLHCVNADDMRSAATTIVAQRVALEVEASFWPEEFQEFASPADRRTALDADLTGLTPMLEACRASDDDGGDGGESDSRTDPGWYFPPPVRMRY